MAKKLVSLIPIMQIQLILHHIQPTNSPVLKLYVIPISYPYKSYKIAIHNNIKIII